MMPAFLGREPNAGYPVRCELSNELHLTHSLTKREDLRRSADDTKTGSHLEVGEFVKRRMSPGRKMQRCEHSTLTDSSVRARKGRAALIHDTDRNSCQSDSGVSEYPEGIYPEQKWDGAMPEPRQGGLADACALTYVDAIA